MRAGRSAAAKSEVGAVIVIVAVTGSRAWRGEVVVPLDRGWERAVPRIGLGGRATVIVAGDGLGAGGHGGRIEVWDRGRAVPPWSNRGGQRRYWGRA